MQSDEILQELDPLNFDFKNKLEEYVTARISELFQDDRLLDTISDVCSDKIGDIRARDIDGLSDVICDIVSENTPSVSADDISGLDDAIQSKIDHLTFEVRVS